MIEILNPKYRHILRIPEHVERWERMLKINDEDHASFRVLFSVETLATLEWVEPTPARLNELLDLQLEGKRLAVKWDDMFHLIQAVWPLQMAKREVQKMRLIWGPDDWKNYPLGTVALSIIGCITTWWALESLINDIAGILLAQRKDSVKEKERMYIEEKSLDVKRNGALVEKISFQSIEKRILFVYRWATGKSVDKSSDLWKRVIDLKNARNTTIHGIGKSTPDEVNLSELHHTVYEGLLGVSQLIEQIFTETPEFRSRHSYHYLAFWGCKVQAPIVWDGKEGNIYIGVTQPNKSDIFSVLAPELATIEQSGELSISKMNN